MSRSGLVRSATDASGAYRREPSRFRNWVTCDGRPGPTGDGGFPAVPGRYHLYVALLCPWASRTLLARALKKLEVHIGISIVEPFVRPDGWAFGSYPGSTADALYGAARLRDIYAMADPGYGGRATVPVLWDRKRRTIVSNESADIVRMLDSSFDRWADNSLSLYPEALGKAIERLNARMHHLLNDGVYRAGFATSRDARIEAVRDVFGFLDELEERLAGTAFLFGDRITASDVMLFPTLVRFDLAYHPLFGCDLRRLSDYPRLSAYLDRLLAKREFSGTVDVDHIRQGYFSMPKLNPSLRVPTGPDPDWVVRLGARHEGGRDGHSARSASTHRSELRHSPEGLRP